MILERVTKSILVYFKCISLRLRGVPADARVLMICRTADDVLTARALLKFANQVIVAVDDPKLRTKFADLGVDQMIYIEQDESYDVIVDDEIAVRKRVNEWLRDLGKRYKVPQSVMSWCRQPEGDQTTQRIRDILLLVRWHQQTIRETDADHLVVTQRPRYQWENEVLLSVARNEDVDITIQRTLFAVVGDLFNFSWLPDNISYWFIPLRIRCLVLRIRWWVRYCRIQISQVLGTFPSVVSEERLIGFQLANSSFRHIENIAPVMSELKKKHKFTPIGITWGSSNSVSKLRDHDIEAVQLKQILRPREALQCSQTARTVRSNISCKKYELFESPQMTYRGVDVGPLLWPSIRLHLGYTIQNRIGMYRSLDQFSSEYSLCSLKVWNGGDAGFGGIACDICNKKDITTFFFPLGIWITSPYDHDNCDRYLVSGEYVKQNMVNAGFSPEKIVVTGKSRFSEIASFQEEYSLAESRSTLNLPDERKRYFFFAPQPIIRGVISQKELIEITNALYEFARSRSDICLLIKPHPDSDGTVRSVVDQRNGSCKNVVVVSQDHRPLHCINASDVTVTKSSNVGIESMVLGRPLISSGLCSSGYREELYGDAAEFFTNTDEMIEFMKSVVADDTYERFKKRQTAKQKRHLSGLFTDLNHTETMAAAIVDFSN